MYFLAIVSQKNKCYTCVILHSRVCTAHSEWDHLVPVLTARGRLVCIMTRTENCTIILKVTIIMSLTIVNVKNRTLCVT